MNLQPFKLERYFAQYEFSVEYLLSSSDCDGLPMADLVAMADPECRQLWDRLTLGYTESLGHPLLREEIAGLYAGISAVDCLVAAPEECIFLVLNALLRPGDHVICTFPGYQSLHEIARSLGCEVTLWQPVEAEGWRFDPAFLEQHMRPTTRLVIVNFPHNPTGYLSPREDFERIIAVARQHQVHLFSDEMYRLLEYNPEDRLPSACEVYDKAITLSGMSKAFGLAGARIGWIVTVDQPLLSRMAELKDYTTICNSAPSEVLALIALRSREAILQKHQTRIRRNLALLDQFFKEHTDRFEWIRPRAGTIAFPRLTGQASAQGFCQALVRSSGVLLLPSTVYDYGDRHFRLGFGRENMPAALHRFQQALDQPGKLS